MKASSIAPNFWLSCIAIAPPLSSGLSRSSNGSSVTKTMPAFELLVKPAIERPGKATALSTPGCSRAMSLIRRITSSVRSRVAPSGSWAKPTRYCLSWAGTKPPGTALKTADGHAEQGEIDPHHQRLAREHAPDAAAVGLACRAPKTKLKPRNSQPNSRLRTRVRASSGASRALEQQGGQRRRQRQGVDRRDHRRDGDRQRELVVEAPGQAADEGERHEDRDEHRRDGDDRARHLAHRLVGGVARAEPVLDVALDVLDDDDRVVDDDADGEHQRRRASAR